MMGVGDEFLGSVGAMEKDSTTPCGETQAKRRHSNAYLLASLFTASCLISCGGPQTDAVQPVTDTVAVDTLAAKMETAKKTERPAGDTTYRIYLTFDDGPYRTTPKLIELLRSKGIRASFFLVGSQIAYSREYDSLYRLVRDHPDFKVYNHSYSHAVTKGRIDRYYSNPASVWSDLERNKPFMASGPAITRLPGLNTWRTPKRRQHSDRSRRLVSMLDSRNITEHIVGWDIEWKKRTGNDRAFFSRFVKLTEDLLSKAPQDQRDVVILSHDYLYSTPLSLELLGEFIDHFQRKGNVRFDWVENLPGVDTANAFSWAHK
jgi:peptidoglycan/xylan/chitin deacetylase (PgdA/CDA1 family)